MANQLLKRVWRFFNNSKRWLFYYPSPGFARFNAIRTVSVAAETPAILLVNVDRRQQFRGIALYPGWNFIPIEPAPPPPSASNEQSIAQLFRPLIQNGTLERVWRLNPRTQGWELYDPDPSFAAINTLSTVDLSANPPVVLAVLVTETLEFRDMLLHEGWNYVLMR